MLEDSWMDILYFYFTALPQVVKDISRIRGVNEKSRFLMILCLGATECFFEGRIF